MSLSVKIDKIHKEKLERFVASLVLNRGIRVTLQEALGLMVDYSLENEAELVKKLKNLPPLEQDPAWKMIQHPNDWKIRDASERVDEFLYR